MLFSLLALFINIGFKVFLSQNVDKDSLALFFTAIDIFSLSLLILVGFRSSMVVTYAKTKQDAKVLNIFRAILVVFVLFSWALIIPFLKHEVGIDIHYWYLVSTLLSMALWTYLSNQISMYRLYKLINYSIILEPLFGVFWFLFAWILFSVEGFHALFISAIMGSFSLSFFLSYSKTRSLIKEPPFKLEKLDTQMKLFLKNSFVSTLEFGSGIVIVYLCAILLLNYHTQSDLGDFQVVVKPILIGLISVFVYPIFKIFLPEFSKLVAAKDMQKLRDLRRWNLNFIATTNLILIVIFILFGKSLILFLFGDEYINAYFMLGHLVFFFSFIALNAVEISTLKAFGAFTETLLVRLLGAIFFVVVFFVLRFFDLGTTDVVMALSLTYFFMFVLSYFLAKKYLKKHLAH